MASTNVEFYEKVKELQDTQHESEEERWRLEQQLNSYVRSDKKLAKLKAARLQSYWKKICEDEKKSTLRNEQLLKDFNRIETQLTSLSTKTEKLRILKKQYEDYIDRMYPRWKESQLLWQREQHIGPQRLSFSGEAPSPIGGAVGPPAGYTADTNGISQKTPTSHAQQNVQQQRDFLILRTQGHAPSQQTNKDRVEDDNQHSQPHPINIQNDRPPEIPPKGGSSMYADDDEWSEAQSPAPVDEPIIAVSVKSTPPKASGSANQLSVRSRSPDQVVQDLDTWNSTKTGTPRPPPSPPRSARHSASDAKPPKNPLRGSTDDVSDIETDMSLPLTDRDSPMKVKVTVSSQQEAPPAPTSHLQQRAGLIKNLEIKKTPSLRSTQDEHPVTPTTPAFGGIKPDISRKGFYILLRVVQEDFPISMNKQDFYRTQMPAPSVKKEIIDNADHGNSLVHLNPSSISMVLLHQLPLMARNNKDGCLLTDALLNSDIQLTSEAVIRPHIEMSSHGLWEKLIEHLKQIIKNRIMTPHAAASTFAPYLLREDSSCVDKAVHVLSSLLQTYSDETVFSDTSSVTIPSPPVSPHYKPTHGQYQQKQVVPPLELPDSLKTKTEVDEDDDDDFFTQDIPKDDVAMPLTQTAAYRSLLTGTQTTTASAIEAESDLDDVENQVGSMLSPGGSRINATGVGSVQDMRKASGSRDDHVMSADDASSISSPIHTPAYVPSSINNSGKTGSQYGGTFKSKGLSSKKPAYLRTDSDFDTDTETDGAMGISASRNNKIEEEARDEFDFYDS